MVVGIYEVLEDGKERHLSVKQMRGEKKEKRLELLTLLFFPF